MATDENPLAADLTLDYIYRKGKIYRHYLDLIVRMTKNRAAIAEARDAANIRRAFQNGATGDK